MTKIYFITVFLLSIFLFGQECDRDVCLSIQNVDLENKSFEIYLNNIVDIGGFQFKISGVTGIGVSGGIANENNFTVSASSSSNIILGFSLTAETISPTSGVLINVSFNEYSYGGICFDLEGDSNLISSPANSSGYTTELNSSLGSCWCHTDDCSCISGIYDCNGICDGDAIEDCSGVCMGSTEQSYCDACESKIYDCNGRCDNESDYGADFGCDGICSNPPVQEDQCGNCGGTCTGNCIGPDGCSGNPNLALCSNYNGGGICNWFVECTNSEFNISIADECGICSGAGPIYECGCTGLAFGSCDCDGNVDLGCGCGEQGPSGCDETCGSNLEFDECGICDGSGPQDGYDCNGNILDIIKFNFPKEFSINNIYPNPFNPITNIDYHLPKNSYIKIDIYNLNGNFVTNLYDGIHNAGFYSLKWNAQTNPSGLYIVKMYTLENIYVAKLLLIK